MIRNATFSENRKYRYALERKWLSNGKGLLYIGLNPSTADESVDDPTIRRCIHFARVWGYSSLMVCNLFAFRATFPSDLFTAKDPIGPQNDFYLQRLLVKDYDVFVGWGNHGKYLNRDQDVLSFIPAPQCIQINKSGSPSHPLYLKNNSVLKPFLK